MDGWRESELEREREGGGGGGGLRKEEKYVCKCIGYISEKYVIKV